MLESINLKCLSCKINMEFSLAIFILLPLHFLLCQSWCNPSLTARCCLSCTGRGVRPPYSASFQPGFLHKLGPRSGSAFPCWLLPISGSSRHSLTLSVLVPTSPFLLAGRKCRLELLGVLCASSSVPSVSPQQCSPWPGWHLEPGDTGGWTQGCRPQLSLLQLIL